jgi:hypothetical protein
MTLPVLLVAAGATGPPPDDQKAGDAVRKLAAELVAHAGPVPGIDWGEFRLVIAENISGEALAAGSGWFDWPDGKRGPYVKLTRGLVKELRERPDALALVIARELGRLAAGPGPAANAAAGSAIAAAAREAAADRFAVGLVLRTGYSVRQGLRGPPDDPSRKRLTALLDDPVGALWREMPAYQLGGVLLHLHDYGAAETLFDRVSSEFPGCFDSRVLLGTARLQLHVTRYVRLEAAESGRGRVLGAGGEKRGPTLIRGRDRSHRWESVGVLRDADRLKPNQYRVLALLGTAYCLHPESVKAGLTDAEKYLTASLAALRKEKEPNPAAEAALLVNLAVVDLAAGRRAEGRRRLDAAAALADKLPPGAADEVRRAVAFNRGLAEAADGKPAEAAARFREYLESAPRSNAWWEAAYKHYAAECAAAKIEPMSGDELKREPGKRNPAVVALPGGRTIAPGDDPDELQNKLGKPSLKTTIHGTALVRLRYAEHGIEVVSNGDEVLAVTVTGAKGPAVVRAAGPVGELRPGMTRKAVEALPNGTEYAFRPFAPDGVRVAYYPAGGVAVVYDRPGPDGVVTAVLVGQIPGR